MYSENNKEVNITVFKIAPYGKFSHFGQSRGNKNASCVSFINGCNMKIP